MQMDQNNKWNRLRLLIMRSLENSLTPEEIREFQEMIASDPEARQYYIDYMMVHGGILQISSDIAMETNISDRSTYQQALSALAEDEKNAPAIELPKEEPERILIQKVVRPKTVHKVNKLSLATAIVSVAALFLMIAYVQLMPPRAFPVATLIDSSQAEWADSLNPTMVGSQLFNYREPMRLLKGVVKIQFDYGAEVILEGPAEIVLKSPEQMLMNYGKLYTHAPQQAAGFTVDTPGSKVIDIGTEFGIKVDIDGNTDVHMYKGKASLVPGPQGEKKESQELVAGHAKAVTPSGQVRTIALAKQVFVRKFDSSVGLLWRGESLDLADIVGGGNGLGSGIINNGINVITGGRCSGIQTLDLMGGPEHFVTAMESKLIDGVFVVNNRAGQVPVDSTGHLFAPGYLTEGRYWGYIMNGAFHNGNKVPRHTLMLDGRPCGTKEDPTIGIHPNLGITFDLGEIRKRYPGITIDAFTALAGISETVQQHRSEHDGNVDAWVLLDGEVEFSQRMNWRDGSCEIDISIQSENRFLTLIMTDAGDNDNISYDWAMFVRPTLKLVLP